jgi:hypothetical protein
MTAIAGPIISLIAVIGLGSGLVSFLIDVERFA